MYDAHTDGEHRATVSSSFEFDIKLYTIRDATKSHCIRCVVHTYKEKINKGKQRYVK